MLMVGPAAMGQGEQVLSAASPLPTGVARTSNPRPAPVESLASTANQSKPLFSSRATKTRFILLSACVRGSSLADLHGTLALRNYSWGDPLAKPFARLPAPAYYARGLAIATGVNWLSWKMARSKHWNRLAPLSQLISIAGNSCGISTGSGDALIGKVWSMTLTQSAGASLSSIYRR
jgi:hypothetical protein